MKNAGRQRSSRSGYLLPLVLLRNSSADYTALSSTTPALCLGLWEGSSPPPPATEGHPVGENTSGGSYFLPDLKILQGQHFLEQFFNFLFLFPSSYGLTVIAGRVPALETPGT